MALRNSLQPIWRMYMNNNKKIIIWKSGNAVGSGNCYWLTGDNDGATLPFSVVPLFNCFQGYWTAVWRRGSFAYLKVKFNFEISLESNSIDSDEWAHLHNDLLAIHFQLLDGFDADLHIISISEIGQVPNATLTNQLICIWQGQFICIWDATTDEVNYIRFDRFIESDVQFLAPVVL